MRYAILFLTLFCLFAQGVPLQAKAHDREVEQKADSMLSRTMLFRLLHSEKNEVKQLLISLTPDASNRRRVSHDEEKRIVKKLIGTGTSFMELECSQNRALAHCVRQKILKQIEYVLRHSGYEHLSEKAAKKLAPYLWK
jgi:hypothetical protein